MKNNLLIALFLFIPAHAAAAEANATAAIQAQAAALQALKAANQKHEKIEPEETIQRIPSGPRDIPKRNSPETYGYPGCEFQGCSPHVSRLVTPQNTPPQTGIIHK